MDLVQIPTPEYFSAFVESRIGGRAENQDSFGWKDTPFGLLVTVCDGMGGGPGGKTASSIAVKEIIEGVSEGNVEDAPVNILIKAIRRANIAIIEYGNSNPSYKGMGSTCTVLLINEKCATIAHVGDSRIYQIRGKSKIYRTFDHSMVFGLVKQKVITEEQARLSAQSNVITRALGAKYDVEVDCAELPFLAGDRFVLCTDGIHGSLPEPQLVEMMSNHSQSLGAVTDGIATTIDGEGRNSGGGHDNLTLAIIETNNNSILKAKMNLRLKILFYAIAIICAISIILNIVQASSLRNDANKNESGKADTTSVVTPNIISQ
jgi:protein phosphatase